MRPYVQLRQDLTAGGRRRLGNIHRLCIDEINAHIERGACGLPLCVFIRSFCTVKSCSCSMNKGCFSLSFLRNVFELDNILHHATSHHTTPHHTTPHHTTPHNTTPHHTTPHHTTPHHTTPHHTTPHHTTPHHTTPHHTTPQHTTPNPATPHHTTSRHSTLIRSWWDYKIK